MRTRPGLRYSWKPARARPVFWMCGLVMPRSRPAAPARSSSGSPNASGCDASNVETVTQWVAGMSSRSPGDSRLAGLRVRLDQRHLAVRVSEQHADRLGLDVAEDDDAVVAGVDQASGVGHRHRPDRLPGGLQDTRHAHALATGARRRRRLHRRRALGALAILARGDDSGFRRVALVRLPLALDLLCLLRDLVDRAGQRRFPVVRVPQAMEKLLAARVERDVRAMAVPLARQDRLGRDGAVVQQALELRQLGADQPPKSGGDVYMMTAQFESHTVHSVEAFAI